MLKEIIEQPTAVANTVLGRLSQDTDSVRLDEVGFTDEQWKSFKQIRILACGTSWHAALVGKHMIESLARVPVEVDYASEFRYRNPIIPPDSLFIFITQSGETADTISAQRLVRESGSKILTITNVVGSMTTRIADGVLYTRAGPEIGVASTKAFTTQLVCLYLLALHLGKLHGTVGRCRDSPDAGRPESAPSQDGRGSGLRQKRGEDRAVFVPGGRFSFPGTRSALSRLRSKGR